MNLLITKVLFHNVPGFIICDGRCDKAWGIEARSKIMLSDEDEDDYYFLPDSALGAAPDVSGNTEGDHDKPNNRKHNKWCARQCERSTMVELSHFA